MTELVLSRPRVDPELILRLQKYRDPRRVPPVVRERGRAMAALAETLVEPRGWVRREAVAAVEAGRVLLADGTTFRSRALARLLGGAAEAALVVVTIGPELERHAEEMVGREQLVEGLLLDTAAWVALDALIKDVRWQQAAEARRRGFRITGRMAPGFADWPLDEQRFLFAAFGERELAVRLTDACVMLPKKSVSAVYGLIPVAPA